MGLMDKFKNLFTDEEIVEEATEEAIEIKEIKKEETNQLPTFMREKIEKESRKPINNNDDGQLLVKSKLAELTHEKEKNDVEFDIKKEIKLEEPVKEIKVELKEENKNSFKFPIDIEENDFIETRSRQQKYNSNNSNLRIAKSEAKEIKEPFEKKEKNSIEKKVSDLYKDKRKQAQEEKKFKATPIISPVYGVLDKNYNPSEIDNNKGENFAEKRHSKNVDFDSVRKKAYSDNFKTLEKKNNVMCENCEYLKEAKECGARKNELDWKSQNYNCEKNKIKSSIEKTKIIDNDNLYNQTIESATENYYSNDITLDEATENYFDYGVCYEKNVREEKNIPNSSETVAKKEIPPVKSSINLLSTLKKSMGNASNDNNSVQQVEHEKNLELTDDLFNLIDSMYDERNEIDD